MKIKKSIRIISLLFLIVLITGMASWPTGGNKTFTLKNVMYQQTPGDWLHYYERADMLFWKNEGVSWGNRKNLMMAEAWRPAKGQIKNIVFLSSGQQGATYLQMDEASVSTGQIAKYVKDNDAKSKSEIQVTISAQSLAGKFIDNPAYGFTKENTLMILVFDSAFNYYVTPWQKPRMVKAYMRYVLDLVGPAYAHQVKRVFLSGVSRGGALVTWMARSFMHDPSFNFLFRNAKLQVATLDGVANYEDRAVGLLPFPFLNRAINPLSWLYKFCYRADLRSYLNPVGKKFEMLQIVGGGSVRWFLPRKRAFMADFRYKERLYDSWYGRFWVNRTHIDIGQTYHEDTVGMILKWLRTPKKTDDWGRRKVLRLKWIPVREKYRHWYWTLRPNKKWWQTKYMLRWKWAYRTVNRLRFVWEYVPVRIKKPWSIY